MPPLALSSMKYFPAPNPVVVGFGSVIADAPDWKRRRLQASDAWTVYGVEVTGELPLNVNCVEIVPDVVIVPPVA